MSTSTTSRLLQAFLVVSLLHLLYRNMERERMTVIPCRNRLMGFERCSCSLGADSLTMPNFWPALNTCPSCSAQVIRRPAWAHMLLYKSKFRVISNFIKKRIVLNCKIPSEDQHYPQSTNKRSCCYHRNRKWAVTTQLYCKSQTTYIFVFVYIFHWTEKKSTCIYNQ